MAVNVPLEGTVRGPENEITALTYALSRNGSEFSPESPISIPAHDPGDLVEWATEIPDLDVGSYVARVVATDAEDVSVMVLRSFSVIPGGMPSAGTGVVDWTSPGVQGGTNTRVGWRFTVGDSPITVTHLRLFRITGQDLEERVIIHRNSDGAVMASLEIAGGTADEWFEQELSSPVVLEGGVQYTISSVRAHEEFPGRLFYMNPEGIEMSSLVTEVRSVYGTASDDLPTNVFDPPDSAWAEQYRFMDFRATV